MILPLYLGMLKAFSFDEFHAIEAVLFILLTDLWKTSICALTSYRKLILLSGCAISVFNLSHIEVQLPISLCRFCSWLFCIPFFFPYLLLKVVKSVIIGIDWLEFGLQKVRMREWLGSLQYCWMLMNLTLTRWDSDTFSNREVSR